MLVGWLGRPSTYHGDGHLSIVLADPLSFEKMETVKLSDLLVYQRFKLKWENLGGVCIASFLATEWVRTVSARVFLDQPLFTLDLSVTISKHSSLGSLSSSSPTKCEVVGSPGGLECATVHHPAFSLSTNQPPGEKVHGLTASSS